MIIMSVDECNERKLTKEAQYMGEMQEIGDTVKQR